MEKFLQQMQNDLEDKILACVKGDSIVKPFSQVYERARQKKVNLDNGTPKNGLIYNGVHMEDKSIYLQVIEKFLDENPIFLDK